MIVDVCRRTRGDTSPATPRCGRPPRRQLLPI